MKNRFEKESDRLLILLTAAAVALFGILFFLELTPIQSTVPADFKIDEESDTVLDSETSFQENKDFYQQDNRIYDVYLSVFPTPDENGEIMDYTDFAKHKSRDHTYNPILDCNIQILDEGEKPDILTVIDKKNATINVRGNSSRGARLKSYKVKLDEEAGSFMGQTSLNINKHYTDELKITTKFQTDILSTIPHIGSYETYFMRVWLRDTSKPKDEQEFEYQGLFTEIEQPNESYMSKRGLSSNGVLYKAEDFAFLPYEELKTTDDPFYDHDAFETKLSVSAGKSNHQAIVNAVNDINDLNKSFEDTFNKYFDEENFLTWLSFNLLMQNTDVINQNYILYNDGYGEKIFFIPWDFDGAMQFYKTKNETRFPVSQQSIQKLNQSVLIKRYLRLPDSIEKIRNKMADLLEGPLAENRVSALLNGYKPVVDKTLSIQPDLNAMRIDQDTFKDIYGNLFGYFKEQLTLFDSVCQYPVPMFVGDPSRNTDGKISVEWDPSYSYQGRTVTYSVQIFSDYGMKNKLYEKNDLINPSHVTEKSFEPGTYFIMVKAIDSKGYEQLSMERYQTKLDNGQRVNVPGLRQFTVE